MTSETKKEKATMIAVREWTLMNIRVVVTLGAVVMLAVIIFVVSMMAKPSASAGVISVSDLVEKNIADTSYLHPMQWKEANLGTTSAFAEQGTSGKSTAVVTMTKAEQIPSAVDAGKDLVASIRTELLSQMSETSISSSDTSSRCESVKNFSKSIDSSQQGHTVGIAQFDGICVKAQGSYRMKLRAVLGVDGYPRTIAVIASEASWKQNEASFDKILASLKQSN